MGHKLDKMLISSEDGTSVIPEIAIFKKGHISQTRYYRQKISHQLDQVMLSSDDSTMNTSFKKKIRHIGIRFCYRQKIAHRLDQIYLSSDDSTIVTLLLSLKVVYELNWIFLSSDNGTQVRLDMNMLSSEDQKIWHQLG